MVSENTPPRFDTAATSPGPSQFDVETTPLGEVPNTTQFNIRVLDPDPENVQMRFFVDTLDYSTLDPFGKGTISLDPSSDGARDEIVRFTGMCDVIGELGTHTLEAWVADTPFIDAAPFNEVTEDPETGRRGTRDVIKWTINCVLPP